MDYTSAGFAFKVKKTLRYLRLYGPSRTAVKVKAQLHMRRRFGDGETVPRLKNQHGHVGLIGCGSFGYSAIAYYLKKNFGAVVRATMDINPDHAISLARDYRAAYFSNDAARLMDDEAIDLVFIASNHASHAEYAIQALQRGKSVHIEKPHVVNMDQLGRLCEAMRGSSGKVNLGFNRPGSVIGKTIINALSSQKGSAMLSWFVAGHEIPRDHWYFSEEEGGRVLGNLCHWTDLVYQMVPEQGRYPIKITPTRADEADCNIVVTYAFADGTIAAITFSEKGNPFEGVRERFAAHRGDVLIAMDDFRDLTIENVDRKTKPFALFRDHGHERNIVRSYEMVRPVKGSDSGCSIKYVWESGELFLKTKEALEFNREVEVQAFGEQRQVITPPSFPAR